MKNQVLCQFNRYGRIISIYKSPEQASFCTENRFDSMKIRMAIEHNTPYKGFWWPWMNYDIAKTIRKLQRKCDNKNHTWTFKFLRHIIYHLRNNPPTL